MKIVVDKSIVAMLYLFTDTERRKKMRTKMLRISEEAHKKLVKVAKKEQRFMAVIIEKALDLYITPREVNR